MKQYFGTEKIQDFNKKSAEDNLKNFLDKCVWLEDFSENVHDKIPDESADIIYIDGNHSFESVLQDLRLYHSKIKSGGLIIGDDFNEGGVAKAIEVFSEEIDITYQISRANKVRQYSATDKFWYIK